MYTDIIHTPLPEHFLRIIITLPDADLDCQLAFLYQERLDDILKGARLLGDYPVVLKIPENMNVAVDQKITVIHKKEDIEHLDDDLIVSPLALIKYYEHSNHQPTDYLYVFVDGVRQQIACNTPIAALVKDVKAVRVGETFYNHEQFNTLLNEETIENGVIETYDNTKCMVQEAFKRMRLNQEKSCGRCVFCREGYMQLVALFSDLTSGKCKEQDFEIMKEIVNAMSDYSNCSVGTNGKKTLLSLLENFNEEVLAHIKGECPTLQCPDLIHYYIDPKLCNGCHACHDVCEIHAILGKKDDIHVIDDFTCTKCGKCLHTCETHAIKCITGALPELPGEPISLKGEKRVKEKRVVRKRVRPQAVLFRKKLQTKVEQTVEWKGNGKMKEMNADVIVVAAGPAGLGAAIAAGEKHLKTIVFEKSNTTGGAANMGMGPLGIDTDVQKKQFNQITVKDALEMHMDYTHWRVDADLVSTYFHKSADTIRWLEDMGVEFAGAYKYFAESEATWHIVKPENGVIGPRAAGGMIKAMTARAKELGAQFVMETTVVDLIKDGDKVVGVRAVDQAGNQIEAHGKAVIVATGGFGNNKEMIEEEFNLHLGEDYYPFQIPGIPGDGLKMMWRAGAMKFGAGIEAIYQLPDNMNWFLLDAVLRQPNLLINQYGERFMNEDRMGNTTFTGNAIALQPGHYAYCIMDGAILNHYKKHGPDIFDIVHPADCFFGFEAEAKRAVEQEYDAYIEASTLDELAQKLQIHPDTLKNTVEAYNEACETGRDTQFGKNPDFLHKITGKGKYLVGKFYLGAYGTIGGIRINKYCEVLGEDYLPIPGLYSAGSDANTIYGDSYNFTLPGNTMGFAVNSGRMAGEAAAKYILDEE